MNPKSTWRNPLKVFMIVAFTTAALALCWYFKDPSGKLIERATSVQAATVIAAFVSLVTNLLAEVLKTIFGFAKARDDAVIKAAVEKDIEEAKTSMRAELETKVLAKVTQNLKSHEARLKVAGDAYTRLMERKSESVSQVRGKINAAEAAVARYQRSAEAWGEATETETRLQPAEDALDSIGEAFGLLPVELVIPVNRFIMEMKKLLFRAYEWSSKTRDERSKEYTRDATARADLMGNVGQALTDWQSQVQGQYEAQLAKEFELETLSFEASK